MTAVAFDTLKFVRTLRDRAKFTPEQAEGLSDAIAEAVSGDLATKADVVAVRTDLESLRQATKAEFAAVRSEVREVELRLEAKIEATKTEVIKWMVGLIGFNFIATAGVIVGVVRFLRP